MQWGQLQSHTSSDGISVVMTSTSRQQRDYTEPNVHSGGGEMVVFEAASTGLVFSRAAASAAVTRSAGDSLQQSASTEAMTEQRGANSAHAREISSPTCEWKNQRRAIVERCTTIIANEKHQQHCRMVQSAEGMLTEKYKHLG